MQPSVSPCTQILMILNNEQILRRMPPQFLKNRSNSKEIFDGLFGSKTDSISAMINELLKREKIYLEFINDSDVKNIKLTSQNIVIIFDTVSDETFKKVAVAGKKILFIYESITLDTKVHTSEYQKLFDHVITSVNSKIEDFKTSKYFFPVATKINLNAKPFNERKGFCCALMSGKSANCIGAALYLRESFIQYFSDYYPEQFDLFGLGWEKTSFAKICKGSVDNKDEIVQEYRFIFCPENTMTVENYITEKLWDAFRNQTIPIYMGAPNIDEYVPKDCYIDLRDFLNENKQLDAKKLYEHLRSINHEEFAKKYFERVKTFLKSEEAKKFKPKTFAKVMAQSITSFVNNQKTISYKLEKGS